LFLKVQNQQFFIKVQNGREIKFQPGIQLQGGNKVKKIIEQKMAVKHYPVEQRLAQQALKPKSKYNGLKLLPNNTAS